MNLKAKALEALRAERLREMAKAYVMGETSLNMHQGRGFRAAEDGWPSTANPYRKRSRARIWWALGYSLGECALEMKLIKRPDYGKAVYDSGDPAPGRDPGGAELEHPAL